MLSCQTLANQFDLNYSNSLHQYNPLIPGNRETFNLRRRMKEQKIVDARDSMGMGVYCERNVIF